MYDVMDREVNAAAQLTAKHKRDVASDLHGWCDLHYIV